MMEVDQTVNYVSIFKIIFLIFKQNKRQSEVHTGTVEILFAFLKQLEEKSEQTNMQRKQLA